MKKRVGFVSNSSSSSFIIRGTENQEKAKKILEEYSYGAAYAMIDDIMVTTFISDVCDAYSPLCEVSDDEIEGVHGEPYSEWGFIKVMSEDKNEFIYVQNALIPERHQKRLQALYDMVYQYVDNPEFCLEDSKESHEYLKDFYKECIKIVTGEEYIDE